MSSDSEPIILELDDERPPSHGDRPEGRAARTHHRTMLLISCGVVVLAFLFEVRPDQRVALPVAPQYPMPETCMSRQLFGLHCPGCGLTRSLIHLAHGDWRASMAMHRLGWMMAAAVLLQFPYRISCLRHGSALPLGKRIPQWFGYALVFAMIVNWLLEMICNPPVP
jgi:hypothetical protein